MSLKDSRIINSVHPWLGARLQWLQEVAKIVGSTQSLISGNRTLDQQRRLYRFQLRRPAAYPGCSQHNYGFAADAQYLPIVQISSKGRPLALSAADTTKFFNSAARHVGLTLVSGDPGHYQVYNGAQFKAYTVAVGLCNPNPPPRLTIDPIRQSYLNCLDDAATRSSFNTPLRDALVRSCFIAFTQKDLARASELQGFTVTGSLF